MEGCTVYIVPALCIWVCSKICLNELFTAAASNSMHPIPMGHGLFKVLISYTRPGI